MKEYFPKEVWLAVILTVIFAVTIIAIYFATKVTPEREAELKAEGAAAFDRRVEAAGGWETWLAKEIAEVSHD